MRKMERENYLWQISRMASGEVLVIESCWWINCWTVISSWYRRNTSWYCSASDIRTTIKWFWHQTSQVYCRWGNQIRVGGRHDIPPRNLFTTNNSVLQTPSSWWWSSMVSEMVSSLWHIRNIHWMLVLQVEAADHRNNLLAIIKCTLEMRWLVIPWIRKSDSIWKGPYTIGSNLLRCGSSCPETSLWIHSIVDPSMKVISTGWEPYISSIPWELIFNRTWNWQTLGRGWISNRCAMITKLWSCTTPSILIACTHNPCPKNQSWWNKQPRFGWVRHTTNLRTMLQ
jgi:hypothetical protein